MNQEIKSQIDRARELLKELKESCNRDLTSRTVSDKTRNQTQEILVKMGSVIDQTMRYFYSKKVAPKLTQTEKEKAKTKIYFPITSDKNSMKSILGRGNMADLEQDYPDIFKFLESIQPYNQGFEWMKQLSIFANERHIRLTPQKKIVEEKITVSKEGVGVASWTPKDVRFKSGASILGAPVDPATQDIRPIPGVTSKREIWVSFTLGDSGVNSLWLCETAINEGEKIISSFLKLF